LKLAVKMNGRNRIELLLGAPNPIIAVTSSYAAYLAEYQANASGLWLVWIPSSASSRAYTTLPPSSDRYDPSTAAAGLFRIGSFLRPADADGGKNDAAAAAPRVSELVVDH
jgi:hypothetical protein